MAPLADLLADHPLQKKLSINLEGPALAAFEETKQSLSTKTWLAHFDPHAPIFLTTGASAVGIGGSLNQTINGKAVPLGFYAQKMSLTQQRYSTFDRELLAIHRSIQHFRHLLEGRDFYVLTDHRPLQYAFIRNSAQLSPREVRQLDFISQFTTDIRYLPGPDNEVADALSRIDVDAVSLQQSNREPSEIDFDRMADEQIRDDDVRRLVSERKSSLRLRQVPYGEGTLWCDYSTGAQRPLVPRSMRKLIFKKLHHLSHPGVRASVK